MKKFLLTAALGVALVAGGTACYFANKMELFKDDADAYNKFESR
ncbi:hypothetical protein [Lacticaseibacillus paracasei]|nr:hypothetical protein [Lacticaseibacillus paracasei]RNE46165.1 hypothetical protein FAM8374_00464 [Lacticaseibacillus paracasei]